MDAQAPLLGGKIGDDGPVNVYGAMQVRAAHALLRLLRARGVALQCTHALNLVRHALGSARGAALRRSAAVPARSTPVCNVRAPRAHTARLLRSRRPTRTTA